MNDVYIRLSRENFQRIQVLIDKDTEHRDYMRKKSAEKSGRDPNESSRRTSPIVFTVVDVDKEDISDN